MNTKDIRETVTYTTHSASGKMYAVRVLKDAPLEAHEEAKKHLAWKAANENVVLSGNPYMPLHHIAPTTPSNNN